MRKHDLVRQLELNYVYETQGGSSGCVTLAIENNHPRTQLHGIRTTESPSADIFLCTYLLCRDKSLAVVCHTIFVPTCCFISEVDIPLENLEERNPPV